MPATKRAAKRPAMRKAPPDGRYTKPALREKLKDELMAGDKGGRKGQWSARKSQLLAQAYEKAGGDYKGGKSAGQKNLETWTKEQWQTKDGESRARRGKTTVRYLPKKAWDQLTPAERTATDKKKRAASRKGKQAVANTPAAKLARKTAGR